MSKPKGLKHTNIQFTIYQQYINELKHSMAMQPTTYRSRLYIISKAEQTVKHKIKRKQTNTLIYSVISNRTVNNKQSDRQNYNSVIYELLSS